MRFKKSTWIVASTILGIVALLQWSFITVKENEYQQQALEVYLSKTAQDFSGEIENLNPLLTAKNKHSSVS